MCNGHGNVCKYPGTKWVWGYARVEIRRFKLKNMNYLLNGEMASLDQESSVSLTSLVGDGFVVLCSLPQAAPSGDYKSMKSGEVFLFVQGRQ